LAGWLVVGGIGMVFELPELGGGLTVLLGDWQALNPNVATLKSSAWLKIDFIIVIIFPRPLAFF